MGDLFKTSVELILENQSLEGAYIASPSFPTYHYCWLRDGSFIAYAMDLAGEHQSARRFFRWVDRVIRRHSQKVEMVIRKIQAGQGLDQKDFLHTRYTLDGNEENESDWENFQLDGYGTWLWALATHIEMTGRAEVIAEFGESIRQTVRYIENLWYYPNYDVWEENGDKVHTSTLACLYGGLSSIAEHLGDGSVAAVAKRIRSYILTNCVADGTFVKHVGSRDVDSSLLWLAVPFRVVDVKDETMLRTVKRIESELAHDGGLHRYARDTYYGGGEWILLTCWLGWYYTEVGDVAGARRLKRWVEQTADAAGHLPEQICTHVNDPSFYPRWVERWGEVARPLLWSHAMYMVLVNALMRAGAGEMKEAVHRS